MRNEEQSGRPADGTQRDLKGDVRRVPVDREDACLDLGGSRRSLVERRGCSDLGVVLQRLRDLLLLRGRDHGARVRHVRERERQRREQNAAGDREAEREPERPGRGVHAGRLADPVFVDRGERVVVELRDQQPEPCSRDHKRQGEPPARIRVGHDRDDQRHPQRAQREPGADDRGGARGCRPCVRPGSRRRTSSATAGRSTGPSAGRRTRAVIWRKIGRRDHRPAERDVLHHLTRRSRPGSAGARTDRGRAASPSPRDDGAPASGRAHRARARRARSAARHSRRPPATRGCPAPTPPMPSTERTAPTASTCRAPVYGTSLTSPICDSTTAMITASSRKPTRQDR